MKRVLSVLLICALLMAGMATVASAEDTPASITITADETAASGDPVTAVIQLKDYIANSWSAVTVVLNYDSVVLDYVNAESGLGDSVGLEVEQRDGKILLCLFAAALPAHAADGYLAKVHFKVKEMAENAAIQIGAGFLEGGVYLEGATTPVDNQEGAVYDEEVAATPTITITPEAPTSATITTTEAPGNRVTIRVRAKYDSDGGQLDVYKIDISWDEMSFTYNAKNRWNFETHTWDLIKEESNWTASDPKNIEIVNHSSQPVTAKVEYIPIVVGTDFDFEGVDFNLSENAVTIEKCEEGTALEATPKRVIAATFKSGAAFIEEGTPLGTIKVTIT